MAKSRMFGLACLMAVALCQLTEAALECQVESRRCAFPFRSADADQHMCVRHNGTEDFVCQTKFDDDNGAALGDDDAADDAAAAGRWAWSVCSNGCFDNGLPMDFSDPAFEAVKPFCRSQVVSCVFPFVYEGESYSECTDAGSASGRKWCATVVDPESGNVRENYWAPCDMDSCKEMADPVVPDPITGESSFSGEEGLSSSVTLNQADPDSPVKIEGSIAGLKPGTHSFRVYDANIEEVEGQNCSTIFQNGNDKGLVDFGEFQSFSADSTEISLNSETDSVSLYGEDSILGKTILIYTKEGEEEKLVGCAPLVEPTFWTLTVIIIIVLVVVILLLVLLICCLCCYCCCKKKKDKRKLPDDETDLPYANGNTKQPLYDELSIPFIDASPAPTPKTGRSTERLSFFHRSSSVARSRGSLSQEEA